MPLVESGVRGIRAVLVVGLPGVSVSASTFTFLFGRSFSWAFVILVARLLLALFLVLFLVAVGMVSVHSAGDNQVHRDLREAFLVGELLRDERDVNGWWWCGRPAVGTVFEVLDVEVVDVLYQPRHQFWVAVRLTGEVCCSMVDLFDEGCHCERRYGQWPEQTG